MNGRVTNQKWKKTRMSKFSSLHYVISTIEPVIRDYHCTTVYHHIGHNIDDPLAIAVYKGTTARLRLGHTPHSKHILQVW